MAGILISPKIDMQIRNKNAAYRKKFGSPHFRDVLRQRCRTRIKERRGAIFDSQRPLASDVDVRSALTEMLRSDIDEIGSTPSSYSFTVDIRDADVDSMDTSSQPSVAARVDEEDIMLEIEKEAANEEEKYLMEIYEQLLEEERAFLESLAEDDETETTACPLCLRGKLSNNAGGGLSCDWCPARLPSATSAADVKRSVESVVADHDRVCSRPAGFAVLPGGAVPGLFLVCHSCASFAQVV